jgi:ketosteroid isomerase-like protein
LSKENVEVVRAIYASMGTSVRYDLIDPDIEMDFSERVFNPAVYRGHDGLQQLQDDVAEIWDEWITEPEELIDAGEHVVALVRTRGRGRGSGVEVESRHANLWTLRDGKAVRYRFYREPDDALRAVRPDGGGGEAGPRFSDPLPGSPGSGTDG